MLSNKDITALQKTYDNSYLSCSTAVYYEGQGDEGEATRYWKAALRRINEYYASSSAPRVSESYTSSDTVLIDALKELELQCKERIDLLEALKLSREDSLVSTDYNDSISPRRSQRQHQPGHRDHWRRHHSSCNIFRAFTSRLPFKSISGCNDVI
ncbi:uncharacterized protein TrAtP1_008047 [Trichoderma atroviride]|uniref:uncharacterized protein n=1 Tax=Hypocrea atroviridis TaxID=63577 RepID=UPI00331FCDE9|nr:hypothetical protein TrAtP1_008047 [Trichoderma atroviride]